MKDESRQIGARVVFAITNSLEISIQDVKPEVIAEAERLVRTATDDLLAVADAKLAAAYDRIEELETVRPMIEAEYEPLASDISYALGVRDGEYITRETILELLEDSPKEAAMIKKEIPEKKPSEILKSRRRTDESVG